jgi:hypothetical protein
MISKEHEIQNMLCMVLLLTYFIKTFKKTITIKSSGVNGLIKLGLMYIKSGFSFPESRSKAF